MTAAELSKILRGALRDRVAAVFWGEGAQLAKVHAECSQRLPCLRISESGGLETLGEDSFLVFTSPQSSFKVPETFLRVLVEDSTVAVAAPYEQFSVPFALSRLHQAIADLDESVDEKSTRRAVFLDRDGIVIDYVPYLNHPDHVRLRPELVPVLRFCNQHQVPILVVSNQSGVGRGLISEEELFLVTQRVKQYLAKAEVFVDDFFHSTFHSQGDQPVSDRGYFDRKPLPGMIWRAARRHRINLSASWLLGDRISDAEAGLRAGVGNVILCNDKVKYAGEFSAYSTHSLPLTIHSSISAASVALLDAVQAGL